MKALYLLLGSNLGDRSQNIAKAVELISSEIGPVMSASSCYETEPWGNNNQGLFLNMALHLSSNEDPFHLLGKLLSIEQRLGRTRNGEQNSARIIDIDILFYGDHIISSEKLIIPHPRLQFRRFVLVPMNEIAPDLLHPVSGFSIGELLGTCPDMLNVSLFDTVVNFS